MSNERPFDVSATRTVEPEKAGPGCGSCYYARAVPTDPRNLAAPKILQCRFAPPRTFPVMAQGMMREQQLGTFTASWPSVQPADWCGQWQQGYPADLGGN
jgi:hypothetical protein